MPPTITDDKISKMIVSVFETGDYDEKKIHKVVREYSQKLFEIAKKNIKLNMQLIEPTEIKYKKQRANLLYNIMEDEVSKRYSLFILDHMRPMGVILQASPFDLPIIKSVCDHADQFPIGRVLITYDSYRNPLQLMGQNPSDLSDLRANVQRKFLREISESQLIIYPSTCDNLCRSEMYVETPSQRNKKVLDTEKLIAKEIVSRFPEYKHINGFQYPGFMAPFHSLPNQEQKQLQVLRPFIGLYPKAEKADEIYNHTCNLLKLTWETFLI
jgi:hypothetical protein